MKQIIKTTWLSGIILSLVLVVFSTVTSLHAQVITLDSVLAKIDRQNPMLLEYDQKIKATEAYAEGAKSWMAPMVGVGPFWYPYPGQMLMDERDKGMIMAVIEQDIPNPAKLKAKQKYMDSQAKVEIEKRAVQFNMLKAEAKEMYYQSVIAAEQMKVLRKGEEIVELMIRLARIRYPYNQSSLGSIYKAEGRLAEIKNMKLMTEGDAEESLFRLKSLMNMPGSSEFVIDTSTVISWEPLNESDTSALKTVRSDIRQVDETIRVMGLNQELQRKSAKPDFRIRFEHMQPRGDMPTQFSAMAMISIPIAPWSSKMYKSEIKGMKYDIEAMKKGREGILLEAKGMIASMNAQLKRMSQQLENYEKGILPPLRKNYETVMIAYEENREQLPAVIDAWEGYNMAALDYLQKKREFSTMIVEYEKQLEK